MMRTPYFCPGCPHNLSTRVPDGSCALGGVGCHLMAVSMGRNTVTISQMGGEGATWLGMAAHSGTRHVFANMGDGTYYHSGLLAIRAAVAAGVNITYKLLYNDAVAMTGGQPVDGPLSVPQITRQVADEGVQKIVVLADDPQKYGGNPGFAPGVEIRHRDELERTQRELRDIPGVTALVYDQTCAAEKRRRRKRGTFPDPAVRVFINELACEGCGDCSIKSNCLSVVPVETEFGRKRAIDQSTCNKDYACVTGFCPSILTVHGGQLRRGKALAVSGDAFAGLPEPALPDLERPVNILVTGVGGTGVVTIGALIGMAAHIDGKGVSVLDMTGLAQKGGAVMSHVRLAARQEQLHATRIATGEADTLLGCDIVVAVSNDALVKTLAGRTRAFVNTGKAITGDFVRNPDHPFPLVAMEGQIRDAVGGDGADFLDASRLATLLMGNSIATNLFMLGYAWQKGRVPLSHDALLRAIELNGVAVADNRAAFLWGRRAAHDLAAVERLVAEAEPVLPTHELSRSLDEIVSRRRVALTDFQDAACADRYSALVQRVQSAEAALRPGSTVLAEAVARNYFRLLAYKDEYEVARLYSDPEFERMLSATFEGDYRLRFHLAVPLFSRTDPNTGLPKKHAYGGWMRAVMRLLAKLKFLRGSVLDPFGHSEERRLERALIGEYEKTVEALLSGLRADNLVTAAQIARLPETIRGYGPIKLRNAAAARARQAELMSGYDRSRQNAAIAA
jgi:indolepyruvate ferredoxin oxidoreductase